MRTVFLAMHRAVKAMWIVLSSVVKSSQVTFIYIALLTIQIVTKQLHNIKMGK